MSAARSLGFIYILMASVFGVAIALHQHPDWQLSANAAGQDAARFADENFVRPSASAGMQRLTTLFDAMDPVAKSARGAIRNRDIARRTLTRHLAVEIPRRPAMPRTAASPRIALAPAPALRPNVRDEDSVQHDIAPRAVAPGDLGKNESEKNDVATNSAAQPRLALVQTPSPSWPSAATPPIAAPSAQPLPPAELARVVERLKSNLTPEMLANFELFLYVSKADHGPWAQHMYVFAKADDGDLLLKYTWLVSTGREQDAFNDAGVRMQTHTPQGYYQLDPQRIYRHYTSQEWGQPMPYAMFFNWIKDGYKTGLAIHGAIAEDAALLGARASAGCIRLSSADASTLFTLVKSQYRGLAPRFAINRRTGTMSNDGILLHDPDGHVRLAEGYKVLVFIENYGGDDNVVAALY